MVLTDSMTVKDLKEAVYSIDIVYLTSLDFLFENKALVSAYAYI